MNKKAFRIVFMGTPDFAVASLKALVEAEFNIVAVVTSPDKPAGRGQKLQQSAVKNYAVDNNLQVLQPSNLKAPEFLEELKQLNADLQVIVAFRMLPESVWSMPRLGSINLHGSLLPQYRGAAPINWAIINGEQETGVTTFFLKHEIDTGDILFQEKIPVHINDTAGIVHDQLMEIGARLIVKTVNAIQINDYQEIPQQKLVQETLKHAPKIFKEDCKVNWEKKGLEIHNLIRGLSPYPTAWSELSKNDETPVSFKIFNSTFESAAHTEEIGSVFIENKMLKIAVTDGFIQIHELQLAGKKRMTTEAFLSGLQANTKIQLHLS